MLNNPILSTVFAGQQLGSMEIIPQQGVCQIISGRTIQKCMLKCLWAAGNQLTDTQNAMPDLDYVLLRCLKCPSKAPVMFTGRNRFLLLHIPLLLLPLYIIVSLCILHRSLGSTYQYFILWLLFLHGNIKHIRTVDVPSLGFFHLNISVGSWKKLTEF